MTRIFSVTTILIGGIFSCAPLASTCAAEDYTITTDHIYGHKAGMALTFDVIRPTENANGIGLLYMVSRGWVSNYFDLDEAMAKSQKSNGRFYNLIDRGYTLFMVRHGSSPYFQVPDAVSDVRQALRHIRFHADEFNVDADRLGVFGNSAGGHLALMLATNSDKGDANSNDPVGRTAAHVGAVVAYYPPVDLRRSESATGSLPKSSPLDFDASLRDRVSPIVHVGTADDPPTLILHGDKDNVVPLAGSEQIRDEFKAAGVDCKLIVMEGAGHAFPGLYGARAASELADWFDQHLLNPK